MRDEVLVRRSRKSKSDKYVLRLYVAANTPKSISAIANFKAICESHLKKEYELTVVDLPQSPERALLDQILGTPTLIKRWSVPVHRMISGFSRIDRVLEALDLPAIALSP